MRRITREEDCDLARSVYADANGARTTTIAYVEATSTVTRMRKGNRLSPAKHRAALNELDAIWPTLDVHEVTDRLLQAAAKTARDRALRAFDAVHLAAALAFAEGEEIAFACWDHELSEAASRHGFALIPGQSCHDLVRLAPGLANRGRPVRTSPDSFDALTAALV
jgi:uncharacterized protein